MASPLPSYTTDNMVPLPSDDAPLSSSPSSPVKAVAAPEHAMSNVVKAAPISPSTSTETLKTIFVNDNIPSQPTMNMSAPGSPLSRQTRPTTTTTTVNRSQITCFNGTQLISGRRVYFPEPSLPIATELFNFLTQLSSKLPAGMIQSQLTVSPVVFLHQQQHLQNTNQSEEPRSFATKFVEFIAKLEHTLQKRTPAFLRSILLRHRLHPAWIAAVIAVIAASFAKFCWNRNAKLLVNTLAVSWPLYSSMKLAILGHYPLIPVSVVTSRAASPTKMNAARSVESMDSEMDMDAFTTMANPNLAVDEQKAAWLTYWSIFGGMQWIDSVRSTSPLLSLALFYTMGYRNGSSYLLQNVLRPITNLLLPSDLTSSTNLPPNHTWLIDNTREALQTYRTAVTDQYVKTMENVRQRTASLSWQNLSTKLPKLPNLPNSEMLMNSVQLPLEDLKERVMKKWMESRRAEAVEDDDNAATCGHQNESDSDETVADESFVPAPITA